jgi:hypothetical protein
VSTGQLCLCCQHSLIRPEPTSPAGQTNTVCSRNSPLPDMVNGYHKQDKVHYNVDQTRSTTMCSPKKIMISVQPDEAGLMGHLRFGKAERGHAERGQPVRSSGRVLEGAPRTAALVSGKQWKPGSEDTRPSSPIWKTE